MTPLKTFSKIVKALAKSPMHFWNPKDQATLLGETDAAAIRLKGLLEKKELTDTQAYKHLNILEKSVTEKEIDELAFTQSLANLVEVYRLAPPTDDLENIGGDGAVCCQSKTTRARISYCAGTVTEKREKDDCGSKINK